MKGHACQLREPPTERVARRQKHEKNQCGGSPPPGFAGNMYNM